MEYRKLRDSGFLTEAEFEAEKKKIFGSIYSHCEGGNYDYINLTRHQSARPGSGLAHTAYHLVPEVY